MALGTIGALAVVAIAMTTVPGLRWRTQVLALHLSGQIPDIDLRELIAFMMPGSDQALSRLRSTRNPYSVIHNSKTSPADFRVGAILFRDNCASCHAPDGSGSPAAPALVGRELEHGESDWALYRTIKHGVPGTAMLAHAFSPTELWQLVAYLRVIDVEGSSRSSFSQAPLPGLEKLVKVSADELREVEASRSDWLTYSGAYNGRRHSSLTQVEPSNVATLAMRWIYQFPGGPIEVEASPIVRNGVMYVSTPKGARRGPRSGDG